MGAYKVPSPTRPPEPVDRSRALIQAINFEETQRRIRSSAGRKSTILAAGSPGPLTKSTALGGNSFTGQ